MKNMRRRRRSSWRRSERNSSNGSGSRKSRRRSRSRVGEDRRCAHRGESREMVAVVVAEKDDAKLVEKKWPMKAQAEIREGRACHQLTVARRTATTTDERTSTERDSF